MSGYDHELDARGLNCLLPILRAKKSIAQMASGQVLHIEATDPGAVTDFGAFVKQTDHQLQESREENGTFHFLIQKT